MESIQLQSVWRLGNRSLWFLLGESSRNHLEMIEIEVIWDVLWMFHGCSIDSIVSFHGESCNGHMVKEMATTPAEFDRISGADRLHPEAKNLGEVVYSWLIHFNPLVIFVAVNGKSHHHNQQKLIFLRTTKGWSWWCDWVVKLGVSWESDASLYVSHVGRQPFCLAKQLGASTGPRGDFWDFKGLG